jgi:hypothetical protein
MNIGLSFVEGFGKGVCGNCTKSSSPCGDPKEKEWLDGDGKNSPEDGAV